MPVERVNNGFKDVSMTFQVNPVNFDLIAIKNETAIARSIRNLIFTQPGERFFDPNLGSKVGQQLFENMDEISASIIQDEISFTIARYEPRVRVSEVIVNPNYDDNEFNVTIIYRIVGIDASLQQLTFALQATR